MDYYASSSRQYGVLSYCLRKLLAGYDNLVQRTQIPKESWTCDMWREAEIKLESFCFCCREKLFGDTYIVLFLSTQTTLYWKNSMPYGSTKQTNLSTYIALFCSYDVSGEQKVELLVWRIRCLVDIKNKAISFLASKAFKCEAETG
uniref:Uncharacterized protein n=1 Tax=Ananas comosus var. bracteatus TaxID=296719 RepID=A0A6V7QAL4_ANACO|nr:unnamed protein product [Ananas comosus var. bracteatus]